MAGKSNTRSSAERNSAVAESEAQPPQTQPRGKGAYSRELLLGLYRMLVKCRMCDEKARILFRQGKFAGNFYSGAGQEATEVGAAYSLREDDWIAPSHRDWSSNIKAFLPAGAATSSRGPGCRRPAP